MVNRALIADRRSLFAARKKATKLQAASRKPGKAPPIVQLHIFKFAHLLSQPRLQHRNHIFLPLLKIPCNDPPPGFFYQP